MTRDDLSAMLKPLEKKVDALMSKVNAIKPLEEKVDALVSATPLAMLKFTKVAVVGDDEVRTEAVIRGGLATWTVVCVCGDASSQSSDSYKYYALESKHCALYYRTVEPRDMTFVSLPSRLF